MPCWENWPLVSLIFFISSPTLFHTLEIIKWLGVQTPTDATIWRQGQEIYYFKEAVGYDGKNIALVLKSRVLISVLTIQAVGSGSLNLYETHCFPI